jgi:hypothetical protein
MASGSSSFGPVTLPIKRSILFGELKLQSCEEANIFYATEIRNNENLDQGDFSADAFWIPKEHSHQGRSLEEEVSIKGDTTIVQGVFVDKVNEYFDVEGDYIVHVYVWVELETEEKKK